MHAILRGAATIAVALTLAACSGGGGATNAPGGTSGPVGAKVCTEPSDPAAPADHETGVSGNQWGPIGAKVGDVISWQNDDGVPHRVALDDGTCEMAGNIPPGGTRSLIFSESGIFPFHCGVHASMKGNIVIAS